MRSTTRFGELNYIFQGGQSQLFVLIARLSVLYEDFQVEYSGLAEIVAATKREGEIRRYKFRYLIRIRRTLARSCWPKNSRSGY